MPKIVAFIIVSSLALAALAVFNIGNVNAREETKFIPSSVLTENQANYGVDKNAGSIPAVSIDIIEDKLHDSGSTSTIPIIKYKYLPSQNPKPVHKDNNGTQAADESESHNNHENNGSGSSSQNNNGDSSSNQNNNKPKDTKPNKGNGTDKPDGKNTDKGSSGSNTNNNKTTDKGNGNSTNSGDSGSSDSTVDLGGNGKGNSSSQSK